MKTTKYFSKSFHKLHIVARKIHDKFLGNVYYKRIFIYDNPNGETLIEKLEEGLKKYPTNLTIIKRSVAYYAENDEGEKILLLLQRTSAIKGALEGSDFLYFYQKLKEKKYQEEKDTILLLGLKVLGYDDPKINKIASLILINKVIISKPNLQSKLLNVIKDNPTLEQYTRILVTNKGMFTKVTITQLIEDIKQHIPSKFQSLFIEIKEELLRLKMWKEVLNLIKYMKYKKILSFDDALQVVMLYQILGCSSESQKAFIEITKLYKCELENDELGYRKLIIYDNNHTRIEYYKLLRKTESVIITFDSINMEWQNPSFGFKLLIRNNVDIIAVRKKKKKTYQQDLQLNSFLNVTKPLISGYKDVMSYGFSLGAYNALYFSTHLNSRVLAISPRLSIHPKFGRTKVIGKYEMKHEENFTQNKRIRPILVYDPKNKLDNKYITEGVLPYFPNAKVIYIPYGGHGIAPHLLKMGLLKEFVTDFLSNKTPKYNRELKVNSEVYFVNLGKECLKRNKNKWALSLIERALKINDKNLTANKLRIEALMKTGKIQEAKKAAKHATVLFPENLNILLVLVDISLELKDYDDAKSLINLARNKFGEQKRILIRINRLSKAFDV